MQIRGTNFNKKIRANFDTDYFINENSSFGIILRSGRECIKAINEIFELHYGLDLFFGYSNLGPSLKGINM